MRDIVAAFVWTTVPFLVGRPDFQSPWFLALIGVGTVHTALAHLAHHRAWGRLSTRALLTSSGDIVVILALIFVTGGWTSPLTPLLYVSMAAVAYRYELRHSLAFGTVYALGYVGVLLAAGDLGVLTVDLVLRVGLLVATGMLASLSSQGLLEAEFERSRTEHAFEDILETVPGDVVLIPRSSALPSSSRPTQSNLEEKSMGHGAKSTSHGDPQPAAHGAGEQPLPPRAAVAEAMADWMPEEAIQRAREALARVFHHGETVEFEVTGRMEDGSRSAFRSVAGPLVEDEAVIAAVLVSTDVTERKVAQRRLRDHAKALKQSNEALARYASLTAHDLREPLRDIVRYLQRIDRRESNLGAESRQELTFVVQRARRLDSLIRALHSFAEVDERPFETQTVDLEDALDDALHHAHLPEPTRVRIHTGALPTITADRRAIVHILAQLVENAHHHAGGLLVHVRVDTEETDEGWRITVADDGEGIPQRYHDRIFEPFRRLDADVRSPRAGMGLATVRRLVERLGGEIEVDSRPGEGARFAFTVPRRSILLEKEGAWEEGGQPPWSGTDAKAGR